MPKHPDFRRQPYRRQRGEYRQALMERYGAMLSAHEAMPPEEKQHLNVWESEFVMGDGEFGTSDWPGWEKYGGPAPGKP